MKKHILVTVGTLLLSAGPATAWIGGLPSNESAERSSDRLCDILQRTSPGDRLEVTVSGIYVRSYEFAMLYDPSEPRCELDVQPYTAVDLPSGVQVDPALEEILADDGRAYVTLRGVLWGPRPLGTDDESLPVMMAYAKRIAGRRYGHMGALRTQMVAKEVVQFERVPASVPSFGTADSTRLPSALPVVIAAAVPQYPQAARRVGIEGGVVLDVRVEDGRVVDVDTQSGDRILQVSASENVKTWRFSSDTNGRFSAKFVFVLELRAAGEDRNVRHDLALPSLVTVIAPAEQW